MRGADLKALVAAVTGVMVELDFIFSRLYSGQLQGTNINTGIVAASGRVTALRRKRYCRLCGYALRILAPDAGQGAALKENSCSDAWSVLAAIPFYIKNQPF